MSGICKFAAQDSTANISSVTGSNQIHLSASSRGISDHFFCFTCDEYVWDCDHLVEERLTAPRIEALEGSQLQSFAYDGKSRVLEIEFRVTAPFVHSEIPLPPPPNVIQYFNVPRYVFTKLTRSKTARMQERYWEDHIRTRFRCQTVRTVCRLPRVWRLVEVRKIRRYVLRIT
jgi:KTSC domain